MKIHIKIKTVKIIGRVWRFKPENRVESESRKNLSITSRTGTTMKTTIKIDLIVEAIFLDIKSVDKLTLLVIKNPIVPLEASSGKTATVSSYDL
tara:strand:- start:1876 stop:2157 length:282 start_codon:yes stop_codon:yes gene_type:complete